MMKLFVLPVSVILLIFTVCIMLWNCSEIKPGNGYHYQYCDRFSAMECIYNAQHYCDHLDIEIDSLQVNPDINHILKLKYKCI